MLLSDEYVVILISSETFRDWGCELILMLSFIDL